MGNVTNLFGDGDLKGCSYYEAEGELGTAMLDESLIIMPLNRVEFSLSLNGVSSIYTREELAEFLHVAKVLVDSEDRFLPKFDLIGCNYD